MSEKVNVGIDLGTTNCTVGVLGLRGQPRIKGPIPSIGAYSNGDVTWGDQAKRKLLSNSNMYVPIRDLKISLTKSEFQVGATTVSSFDMLVSLFTHLLKNLALTEESLGTAVIGTPVNVDSPREHRQIVEKAAQRVGFERVRFVYEPTAALIGAESKLGWLPGRHMVLVVDWGGGTLDLVVIQKDTDVYRELAVKANFGELGGTYIDKEVTERLLNNNPAIKERVNSNSGLYELLKGHVEFHKEKILEDPLRSDDDAEYFSPEWLNAELALSPSLVREVMAHFASRAAKEIRAMLDHAGIRPSEITHVLFAGGVSQSSIVRRTIQEVFPGACAYIDKPQLQTGIGCTMIAGEDFNIELASDFGVRQCDDSLCALLPRGHSIAADCYRRAVFLVTDPHADEALFDFGIYSPEDGSQDNFSQSGGVFQSRKKLWVVSGKAATPGGTAVPEEIMVHVGVDRYLTVAVNAHSNRGNDRKEDNVSEIPLAIRLVRKAEL